MFSKKSSGDLRKSCQKAVDPKKDSVTRLKHLRIVLDNSTAISVRAYFEIHYSEIFSVFYENFSLIEAGLKQKVTKAQREDLENVLYVLERIIVYVPDLIHVRWQFNCIGRILKKLLHIGNCLKIRLDGMRLFLLWLQVLQNNASHECYLIYATLVPNFPPPEEVHGTPLEAVLVHGSRIPMFTEVPIEETEIDPLIPQQPGEKQPENLTKLMLESLLRYSVAEVCHMEWDNNRRSENAFIFLLTCFKRFYLPTIFSEFDTSTSLYKSFHGIPELRIHHVVITGQQNKVLDALLSSCRVSVIQWVVSFISVKKNSKHTRLKHTDTKTDDEEEEEEERRGSKELDSLERHLEVSLKDDGSPNTTLTNSDHSQELFDLQGISEEKLIETARDMVQTVFFSSRLNVDFIVEVLRQGFLLPMSEASAVRKSLRVYKDWIQLQGYNEVKPRFMSEPTKSATHLQLSRESLSQEGIKDTQSLGPSPHGSARDAHSQGSGKETLSLGPAQDSQHSQGPTTRDTQSLGSARDSYPQGPVRETQSLGSAQGVLSLATTTGDIDSQGSAYGSQGPASDALAETPDQNIVQTLRNTNRELGVTDVDSPPYPDPEKTFENLEIQIDEPEKDFLGRDLDLDTSSTKTTSYSDEINISLQQEFDKCDVEAGMQATMRVFITHAANVFLSEPQIPIDRHVKDQVSICESVLHMYKNMVMNDNMDKETWEQLLKVLLKITEGILGGELSDARYSLGRHLASPLFKTLIITWIKASLQIHVSVELWDDFLRVLSSLTHWEELIKEWSKTMDTLTKVLARRVYGLDLANLPLYKLEEQRKKRIRGPKLDKQAIQPINPRTFSTGWSRSDSTSPQIEDINKRLRAEVTATDSHPESIQEDDGSTTLKAGDLATLVQDGYDNDLHPTLRMRSMTVDPNYQLPQMRTSQLIGEQAGTLRASFPTLHQRSLTEDPGGGNGPTEMSAVNFEMNRSSSAGDLLESVSFVKDEPSCEGTATTNMAKSVSYPLANPSHQQQGDPIPKSTSLPPTSESDAPFSVTDAAPLLSDSHSMDTSDLLHNLEPPDRISLTSSLSVHTADSRLSNSMDSNSITPSTLLDELSQDLSPSTQPFILQSEPSTPSQILSIEGDTGSLHGGQLDGSNDIEEVFYHPELSVVSGGTKTGWSSDASVVIWRRMLGSLGDINQIENPAHHAQVIDCLWNLWLQLAKLRDNLGISTNNLITPPPPDYIPPLHMISPWLFKATMLPPTHQNGRLGAYRLLCTLTVRKQDHPFPKEYLTHFYRLLHVGLNSSEQDVVNTIVKYSAPEFFSRDLPGSTMLMLDFIHAANIITNSTDMEAPRISALSLLGSLVCFPNMFCNLNLLEPNSTDIVCAKNQDISTVKDLLLGILLKCGKKEPNSEARCIALCSLSIFLFEELVHATFHSRMKDALNVLLVSLKFSSKQVAQMACDMLLMLSDQAGRLRTRLPETPKKIIEVIAITASTLLPQAHATGDKKLLVSLLSCLLEWCMAVPVTSLLEPTQSNNQQKGEILIHTVFKVLQAASEEKVSHSRWSTNLAELASPDYDPHVNLDAIKESRRSLFIESTINTENFTPGTPIQTRSSLSSNVVVLTAKMVLCHLMNRINHYPLGGGPACFTTKINEFDDHMELDELAPEIFEAPNVQFFIYNDSAIISLVQLPSQDSFNNDAKLLATAGSEVRIIIRDVGGKFSWDTGVLYGPPQDSNESSPADPEVQSYDTSIEDGGDDEAFPHINSLQAEAPSDVHVLNRPRSTLPSFVDEGDADLLDELQQFLGYRSPECLLRPGIPLNLPSPAPIEISEPLEKEAVAAILEQFDNETRFCSKNAERKSMISQSVKETPSVTPESSFFLCRSLMSQLGHLNWNKRSQIDILKKNDKLARELRNLDSTQCRETHKIAVLYVAEGQEDKVSVLSNCGGSKAYENFVAGLGWEVDLATHAGFMGGLQKNQSTGETAPYWATSSVEVIFHVSTRMPSGAEDHNKKMRHLGNDEVHIVWSEHSRDYRRGIIATEFGDVIIAIYPLRNKLYRIQIQRKHDVPFFGPLFDGAIVDHIVLPGLVRTTAINASRGKRLQLPCYQRFYEERARYVDTIIKNHRQPTSFEEFAANVFEPSVANKPLIRRTKPGVPAHLNLHGPASSQTLPALKLDIKSQGASLSFKSSHSPSADKGVQSMAPSGSVRSVQSERAHQIMGHPSNKATGTTTLEKQAQMRYHGSRDGESSSSGPSTSSKSKDKRTPSNSSVTSDLSSSVS